MSCAKEQEMFDAVASELHGLTEIVINELRTQLEIEIDACSGST